MAKKIQASILGKDINLLKNVAKRVVQDRPADIKYFTEVKEFLMDSINNKPDIVAISVNYPHKNATKLPAVFKQALKIPVIVFGENQETKTRKNLSMARADFKISGVITAHNFWMKLCNYQKVQEDEQKKKLKEALIEKEKQKEKNVSTEIESVDHFGPLNKALDESLEESLSKGNFEKLLDQDENSIIDSLFDQLDNEKKNKDKKSNMTHISSKKEGVDVSPNSHLHWEDDGSLKRGAQEGAAENKNPLVGVIEGSSNEKNKTNNEEAEDSYDYNPKANELDLVKETNGAFVGKDSEEDEGTLGKESGEEGREDTQKNKRKGSLEGLDENPGLAHVSSSQSDDERGLNQVSSLEPGEEGQKNNRPSMGLSENGNKNKNPLGEINSSQNKKQNPLAQPKVDEKGRVQLTGEEELKRREAQKQKERLKKEEEKSLNLLKESCEEAMDQTFVAITMEEPRGFETTQVSVLTIDMSGYKGFILITDSFKQGFESYLLEDVRNGIIENLRTRGIGGEVSPPYTIEIPESKYTEVIKEACEFSIYKEEDTGKQLILSFLKREVVQPQFQDCDKEGMIMVDMKTIPPQTPVNFDAFIYLERNKKFVRYLKSGRSLSLKQVKRHIEEKVPCNLYIPKTDKPKLIQFFIQNTISWEFISYSSMDKKSA